MSELVNIWREIGSYNRFADAKLGFLMTILLFFLNFLTSSRSDGLTTTLPDLLGDRPILILGICCSGLLIFVGYFPQLSNWHPLDFLLRKENGGNIYYFRHICDYSSGEAWLADTGLKFLDPAEDRRSKYLSSQIHQVSLICARKFLTFFLSTSALLGFWALSIIMRLMGFQ